ncbi:TIGR04222 domain-containing membrane protein [Kitasatospora sp. NPDC086801]|uniref:TIGR04222 domain-containing membrane protein n=1 Tax=Kitasatospora sp. NPDC086801 TaxID=3364066 RepID=UPI003828BC9D
MALLVAAGPGYRAALRELHRAEREAEGAENVERLYELACLARHVGETALLLMYERGDLVASRSGEVTATRRGRKNDFEAAVVASVGRGQTRDLLHVLAEVETGSAAAALRQRIAGRGLLQDEGLYRRAVKARTRLRVALGLAMTAGVAAVCWLVAAGGNGLPTALAFEALCCAALLPVRRNRPARRHTTVLGNRVLAQAGAQARWRHRGGSVALGGLNVLPQEHDLRLALAGSQARVRAVREVLIAAARARHATAASGSGHDGVGLGGACGGGGCGAGCGGGCGGGL